MPANSYRTIAGGYKVVYEYSNRLVKRGHDVTLVMNTSAAFKDIIKIEALREWLCKMWVSISPKWFKLDERIRKNNAKLTVLYNLGVSIHEELKAKNEDNKIDGYTYKMLNSIKAGNKKEFMDVVIRIHMSMGKDISPIFLEVMQNTDLDFESIGHSFISGLISDKFEKKDENKEE